MKPEAIQMEVLQLAEWKNDEDTVTVAECVKFITNRGRKNLRGLLFRASMILLAKFKLFKALYFY